jgi:hypothetical protein
MPTRFFDNLAQYRYRQRLPARRTPRYQGVFGQSLFGGSGAGTPQQFQSTPYRGSSLTGAYQHAYDQARAQNENRYNRILGGYGELLGQRSPYQAQRMNVHDLYDRRTSDIHANLVGRGLTASTVGMAPQALNERERQFALADIGDKETRYKSDIAQDQLDFMERKTEAYPDYEQLERLSQGLGAGGRGLGGGGGGMGAAKAYQSSWKPYGGGWLARRKSVPGGMPGRGGLEFARQHQKVGMSSFGGFGGIAANYGNPNQYVPVISPVAGGAPIERQMFPGQYDMARRMMTAANLRGPHQYGGSYQERRGGGAQRGMTRDQQRRANLRQEQISARSDRADKRRRAARRGNIPRTAPRGPAQRQQHVDRLLSFAPVQQQQAAQPVDRSLTNTLLGPFAPGGQYEGGYAPGAVQRPSLVSQQTQWSDVTTPPSDYIAQAAQRPPQGVLFERGGGVVPLSPQTQATPATSVPYRFNPLLATEEELATRRKRDADIAAALPYQRRRPNRVKRYSPNTWDAWGRRMYRDYTEGVRRYFAPEYYPWVGQPDRRRPGEDRRGRGRRQ